jgi:hypothetical protein
VAIKKACGLRRRCKTGNFETHKISNILWDLVGACGGFVYSMPKKK